MIRFTLNFNESDCRKLVIKTKSTNMVKLYDYMYIDIFKPFNFKNYYLVKRLYIITRSERFLKFCSTKIRFILIYNKYQS